MSAQPNAGLPSVVDGKMHYDLTPDQLADHLERFITELGVSVVGGCCGTTPEHLRAVVERCRDLVPAPRPPASIEHEPGASSIYSNVAFHQDTSFLVVGERTNANGSKKFRDAMLEPPTGTPPWPSGATRSKKAPTSSTCASTTPAPTAWPT